MKKLCKYLYRLYPKYFKDLMVEELLSEVPDNITAPAIEIMAEKRTKLQKWLLWQAYWLQRRNISDMESAHKVFGMLLQIKAMYHIIGNTKPSQEENPIIGETKPISSLEKDLENVNNFKKGKVVSPGK